MIRHSLVPELPAVVAGLLIIGLALTVAGDRYGLPRLVPLGVALAALPLLGLAVGTLLGLAVTLLRR